MARHAKVSAHLSLHTSLVTLGNVSSVACAPKQVSTCVVQRTCAFTACGDNTKSTAQNAGNKPSCALTRRTILFTSLIGKPSQGEQTWVLAKQSLAHTRSFEMFPNQTKWSCARLLAWRTRRWCFGLVTIVSLSPTLSAVHSVSPQSDDDTTRDNSYNVVCMQAWLMTGRGQTRSALGFGFVEVGSWALHARHTATLPRHTGLRRSWLAVGWHVPNAWSRVKRKQRKWRVPCSADLRKRTKKQIENFREIETLVLGTFAAILNSCPSHFVAWYNFPRSL
jgi:hypothetical protein